MRDKQRVNAFKNIIQMFRNTGAWKVEGLCSGIKINCKLNSSPGTFTRQVYFYLVFSTLITGSGQVGLSLSRTRNGNPIFCLDVVAPLHLLHRCQGAHAVMPVIRDTRVVQHPLPSKCLQSLLTQTNPI